MSDEFDTIMDTSFEDTGTDVSTSAELDASPDVSGEMDSAADTGDLSDASSDIGSLMDEPSDMESTMDDMEEIEPYEAVPNSDVPILQEDGSVDSLESIMTENAETEDSSLDEVEPYEAVPNSDVPILQEDGSVDSLENIMTENAETEDSSLDEVEPYEAVPNSDVPILQEDGSVDSLENIMTENAETEDSSLDEVEPYEAVPNSAVPILQEDGSVDSLESIMTENAETEEIDQSGDSFDVDTSDVTDDGGTDSLDAIMRENAEDDSGELEQIEIQEEPALDAADTQQEETALTDEELETAEDTATDAADIGDVPDEPLHMTQSDMEWYLENASDAESLRQMRDEIVSGRIRIDADAELPADDALDEPSGPALTRDPNEQWEIGNHDIDETVEMMREDLRDKGMEDGYEMEAIVMTERARMQEALARDISGDFSQPYQKPDFSELVRGDTIDTPVQDISAAQTADTVEITDQAESADIVADAPQNIDYDAIYASIDDYDFDGIDYSYDSNRLDTSLESFQDEKWEKLSLDEQKAAMNDLADYVKDAIGLENPPEIVYYNNPVDGDYGGYTYDTNTLEINEHMLYDNNEAADTIAHELWHAYQYQRAANPQNAKDYQYQYGFEHYIRPDDDNFDAYQEQLVEAEARAFAQQFKDRNVTKGVSYRD